MNGKRWEAFNLYAPEGQTPKFDAEFGYCKYEYYLGTEDGKDLWVFNECGVGLGVVRSEEPGDYSTLYAPALVRDIVDGDGRYGRAERTLLQRAIEHGLVKITVDPTIMLGAEEE